MKKTALLGMLALALPGAGCATLSHSNAGVAKTAQEAPKTPTPALAAAGNPDVEIATFIAQAQQARSSGDAATAVKLLSQLVLVAPDDPRVIGEYGKALVAGNRADDAVAFLQRAIQLQPGDWMLYSAQGVAYDQLGQYQSAQQAYSRALELKPGEPAVLNNSALSHMQSGDLAGAERLFRQIPPQSPGYDRVAKNLALLEQLRPAAAANPVAPPTAEAPPAAGPSAAAVHVSAAEAAPAALHVPASTPAPAPQIAKQDIALLTPRPLVSSAPLDELRQAMTPLPASLPHEQKPVLSGIEALRADPTVVMAPVPREQPQQAKAVIAPAPSAEHGSAGTTQKPAGVSKVYVQAGAYLSDARARQAAAGLESLDVKIMNAMVNGREVFRLRIGPFATMAEAKTAYAGAQALGRTDLMIVRE